MGGRVRLKPDCALLQSGIAPAPNKGHLVRGRRGPSTGSGRVYEGRVLIALGLFPCAGVIPVQAESYGIF